jgi:hypothetical protein
MIKTEHIVTLIAENENTSFAEALSLFTDSRTYKNLLNTESLMWAESSEFVFDEYLREKLQR